MWYKVKSSSQISDAAGNSSLWSYRVACFLFVSRALDRSIAVLCARSSLRLATCDLCASVFCFGRKKVSVLQVFYGLGPTVSDFVFSENRLKTVTPFHLTDFKLHTVLFA